MKGFIFSAAAYVLVTAVGIGIIFRNRTLRSLAIGEARSAKLD